MTANNKPGWAGDLVQVADDEKLRSGQATPEAVTGSDTTPGYTSSWTAEEEKRLIRKLVADESYDHQPQ